MSTAATDLAVDIVIDNYNYGDFLEEAIDSALGQSHERVNVIVVDDGSTDASRDILSRYLDTTTVILKENGGQASALNAGMDRCRGDIVIFLDADDVLHREAAARAAAAFAADEALVKVQSRMNTIDSEGRAVGVTKPSPHLPLPRGDLRHDELAFPFDLAWLPTSGNAFRSDAVRRILPIPEQEYRICADWYLVHLTTLLGPVTSLEEIGASYRRHGDNNYEPQAAELDLAHLRKNIRLAQATSRALLELAEELGLERPRRILSLADLATRMTSLRLEPNRHPIPRERPGSLLVDAVRAAARRANVSMPMKLLFVAWFTTMAISPRPLARRLATLFLFPERRMSLNRLFGRLQRG